MATELPSAKSQSLSMGTAYLLISELVFLASNYFLHITLASWFGAELYGIFGVLTALYLLNRAFLNTGLPQATSKFLAEIRHASLSTQDNSAKASSSASVQSVRGNNVQENKRSIREIVQVSLRWQIVFAVVFSLVYVVAAPGIAFLLGDSTLVPYIRWLGVLVVPLSLLALYTGGILNGLRLFREQAQVKIVYPLLRMLATLFFVFWGWQMYGVIAGYAFGIVAGLVWSVILVRKTLSRDSRELPLHTNNHNLNDHRASKTTTSKTTAIRTTSWTAQLLSFSLPIAVGALAISVLRNVSILFVKGILQDNLIVGIYTAAFTISTLPYMALAALPLALLPSISQAKASGNVALVQKYIRQSLRYLLLLLIPVSILLAAMAPEVLELLYPYSFSTGSGALQILLIGSACLALFSTLTSVVTGMGHPGIVMVLSVGTAAILSLLSILFIPSAGIEGAAWALAIASLVALCAIALVVVIKWRALLSVASFFRIALVGIITYFLAGLVPITGWFFLIKFLVLLVLFYGLLYLFGEITREDWILLHKVFKAFSLRRK